MEFDGPRRMTSVHLDEAFGRLQGRGEAWCGSVRYLGFNAEPIEYGGERRWLGMPKVHGLQHTAGGRVLGGVG